MCTCDIVINIIISLNAVVVETLCTWTWEHQLTYISVLQDKAYSVEASGHMTHTYTVKNWSTRSISIVGRKLEKIPQEWFDRFTLMF